MNPHTKLLALVVGIGLLGSACLEGNLVYCEDGTACPGDKVCAPTGQGCVDADQVAACVGLAEGDRCNLVGVGDGLCRDGLCIVAECGDGVIDPGEVCDDGNSETGDGCSLACTSNETCGNGIVDLLAGERCDDSNLRNRDGCSVRCRLEAFGWKSENQSATPPQRSSHAFAYDAARERVVLFGGAAGLALSDTWEYNGTWTRRALAVRPPARFGHAMTYDAARGRVVLFGGNGSVGVLDDTWEYDGIAWTERTPAVRPPARAATAMTYDAARRRVVVFGGDDGTTSLGDTWEYDGTTWTQGGSGPVAVLPQLAYDPVRGRVVLHSGSGETWEYDGTSWLQNATAGGPVSVPNTMAFDAVRRRVVLFTGNDLFTPPALWEYDGTSWQPRMTVTNPVSSITGGEPMVYDVARQRMVVFIEVVFSTPETWELAADWSRSLPKPAPPAREYHAMGYDAARARVVLYGGYNTVDLGDTWEHDGTTWENSIAGPPARRAAAVAFDAARARMVLFGSRVDNFTWTYDGTAWSRTCDAGCARPPERDFPAMAYDTARDRMVLFGGNVGNSRYCDTWEFDGSSWSTPTPTSTLAPNCDTNVPPARTGAAMAYDVGRGRIVMFGGYANGLYFADTWTFDGVAWSELPAAGPPSRSHATMVYDIARGRLVLFGGEHDPATLDDLWELEGDAWVERALSNPPARAFSAMAYDTARGHCVLFGGRHDTTTLLADTWTLGHFPEDVGETCLSRIDYDQDGAVACGDDECWGVCSPLCAPSLDTCATTPRCGDGTCTPSEARVCPADCTAGTLYPILCGDFTCDAPAESTASCPGDCPPM